MRAENEPLMQSDADDVPDARGSADKPGAAIAAAREAKDWSQQDLSTHTRLNIGVIRALEADDFVALGQPVYARGYYRKCANILGLDETLLVRGYEQHTGTDSLVPRVVSVPPIAYRERVMLTPYVLGAALVALIGAMLWWWLADDAADIQSMPAPALDLDSEEVRPAAGTPSVVPTIAPSRMVQPTPVPTPAPAPASEQSAVESAVAAAPALRLELLGDSWVEIRDATGERLVRALLQSGVTREFRGEPPYQVVLGDGNNVRVSLGDRKVDFSNQIKADRQARFQVDVPKP